MGWLLQPTALRVGSSEWVNGVAIRVGAVTAGAVLIYLFLPYAIGVAVHLFLTALFALLGVLLLLAGLWVGHTRTRRRR